MTEARHGSAGARRARGLGPSRGPPSQPSSRRATAWPGRDERWGGWGAMARPPSQQSSRRATAPPGRDEHMGVWGPWRGPHLNSHRGAPRLRRGATSIWGFGGHGGAPISTVIEARHGSAGARRAYGGLGAMAGPPSQQSSRRATAWPGRDEHMGVWGPWRGPHLNSHRGAPRLRRDATSVGGGWGP